MKYLIVIEKTKIGYSAFSPDVEGCVATDHTSENVENTMQEAIKFHLERLALEGESTPEPHSYSKYLEVA